jgi:hypothetical protein
VNNNMLILLLAALGLWGCDGSFEDGGSPVRLVISINPNTTGAVNSTNCGQDLAYTTSVPALAVLNTNRITGSSSSTPCGKLTTLTGAAFQTINGLESTGSPSVFVSIPTKSLVQQYTYAGNNTFGAPKNYVPSGGTTFCPSQMAIGVVAGVAKIAVLDNPYNDIATGCTSSTSQKPRVLIFDVGNLASTIEIDLSAANFINDSVKVKEIAVSIFNNRLYVLGAFAEDFRIRRYDLTATNPKDIFITSEFYRTDASSLRLTAVQNRVLASFSNALNGRVVPIVENNGVTPNTISFGDELRAGVAATDPPIGKTTTIRASNSSGVGFTLFARPNDVLFQNSNQFGIQSLGSVIDATFPPDNSIWELTPTRLYKADTRDFPTQRPLFDSGIDLAGLNPGNVVWTFDQLQ